MPDLKNAAETISKYLKVQTYPLAIKFYPDRLNLPQDIRRPNVFGVKMAFCRINTIARKWGWSFAVTPGSCQQRRIFSSVFLKAVY